MAYLFCGTKINQERWTQITCQYHKQTYHKLVKSALCTKVKPLYGIYVLWYRDKSRKIEIDQILHVYIINIHCVKVISAYCTQVAPLYSIFVLWYRDKSRKIEIYHTTHYIINISLC